MLFLLEKMCYTKISDSSLDKGVGVMKTAVLLFHGFLTDVNDFAPILSELEAYYDYVDCQNLPGHGKEPLSNFSVEPMISAAEERYQKLSVNFDVIDIIGFSMGGALASYIASHFTVRNLVLLAPSNKYLNFSYPFIRLHRGMKTLISIKKQEIKKLRKEIREDDRISWNIFTKKIVPVARPKVLANFQKLMKYCNHHLEEITCNTLILWGEIDQIIPRDSIKYLVKKCKNCTKRFIPNVSHLMLHSPNFENVKHEVLNFLIQVRE